MQRVLCRYEHALPSTPRKRTLDASAVRAIRHPRSSRAPCSAPPQSLIPPTPRGIQVTQQPRPASTRTRTCTCTCLTLSQPNAQFPRLPLMPPFLPPTPLNPSPPAISLLPHSLPAPPRPAPPPSARQNYSSAQKSARGPRAVRRIVETLLVIIAESSFPPSTL